MEIARGFGALLLLVGGALDVARLVIGNVGITLELDLIQCALNFIPLVLIGVGLVAISLFSLPVVWFDLLAGVGFVIAGVLLIRSTAVKRAGK